MLLAERDGAVRVADLSRELGCSEVTIRGDIKKLDEQGQLRRVHGGAEISGRGMSVAFEQGEYYWYSAEKERIAQRAYSYIVGRDSIILDDSTTCAYLARVIADRSEKHITVVTNSLLAAAILAPAKHVELFAVSGHMRGTPPSMLGSFTTEAFKQFRVKKAFMGASGIRHRDGVTSLGGAQREAKRAIMASADEVYVLADHTKFGNSSLFRVCGIEEVTRYITDSGIPDSFMKKPETASLLIDIV